MECAECELRFEKCLIFVFFPPAERNKVKINQKENIFVKSYSATVEGELKGIKARIIVINFHDSEHELTWDNIIT